MSSLLPEVVAVTIPTNGYEDTYNEFDHIYPAALRATLADLALNAVQSATQGITEADIWASGFAGEYSEAGFETADEAKLDRASAAHKLGYAPEDTDSDNFGFDGDDSNQRNIIERDIYAL